ncbi:MAG: transporter substrate-binding domain-containing protein, partial [Microbacteriaceae bacterium]|nr:transporter substrate-binding domain-containing protein [Microbacteriaceae bacterium]
MKKTVVMALAGAFAMAALAGCAQADSGNDVEETTAPEVSSKFSQELHDALPDSIKESGVISVAGETNQPWRIVGADGNLTGFQVDIQEEFSEILGVEFKNDMVVGLPAVKLGVQSARNDIGFGPLLASEATRKDLTFVEHSLGRPSFIYPVSGDKLTSILDMCGATIAHLEGSVAFDNALNTINEECAADGQDEVNRLPLPDINAVILAVESERAQFGGMGAHQAAYTETENPEKFAKYISSEEEFSSDKLGSGFAVDNLQLAEVMAQV